MCKINQIIENFNVIVDVLYLEADNSAIFSSFLHHTVDNFPEIKRFREFYRRKEKKEDKEKISEKEFSSIYQF